MTILAATHKKPNKFCPQCGAGFYVSRYRLYKKKYCSQACYTASWASYDRVGAFWGRVNKTASCWLYTGGKKHNGYGLLNIKGRMIQAHRFSYELANGPIPEGQYVLHKCDTPACVNPGHLFLGTQTDNMVDKIAKGRVLRGERCVRSKLTEAQARKIKSLAWQVPSPLLAKEYGVGPGTIRAIWKGRSWKHLSVPL